MPLTNCFCQPTASACSSIEQARQILQEPRQEEDHGIATYPQSLTFQETRKVIGAAFGGKTVTEGDDIMMYVLKALDLDDDNVAERQKLAAFCMGFFAYETLQKNGLALGLRDKNGDLKAVTVFREYRPTKENRIPGLLDKMVTNFTMMRAYLAMRRDPSGLPETMKDKKKIKKFEKASEAVRPMEATMHEWHSQYAPKAAHWYIALVAVDPDCQRQGCGKKLMSILNEAADQCGMSCYLETPMVNKEFYERLGYEVTLPTTMNFSSKLLGELTSPGFLMTRHPRKNTEK